MCSSRISKVMQNLLYSALETLKSTGHKEVEILDHPETGRYTHTHTQLCNSCLCGEQLNVWHSKVTEGGSSVLHTQTHFLPFTQAFYTNTTHLEAQLFSAVILTITIHIVILWRGEIQDSSE